MKAIDFACEVCGVGVGVPCDPKVGGNKVGSYHQLRVQAAIDVVREKNRIKRLAANRPRYG